MAAERRARIALLAAPETTPSVLFGLYDVLLSVGAVYPDMTVGQPGDSLLDVTIVAAAKDPFRCFGNILVEPHAAIAKVKRADAVVVCDMYTAIDTPLHGRYPQEIIWLQRLHQCGAIVCSVCSGSLLLAEAGLLDGEPCAAHWGYVDLFRRCYPKVRLCPESILNLEGEPRGIITAGGVTSWQDLALHLIARFCGREEAVRTAKVYLLSGHEDGQLPFAAMNRRIQKDDAVIAECQKWIADNYDISDPVAAMAERSQLLPRTFARRFRAATGYLPMDYVHALRIEEAKQLIETDSGNIDEIALQVGYGDPTFFRRLFKRTVALTPTAYRRKFARNPGIKRSGKRVPRCR
jgi:transcriptional regulator GlxA family with amidase domain